MKKFLIVVALFVALSFLAGSAVWSMLGLGNSLDIEGEAIVVTALDPGISDKWESYGGDKFGTRFSPVTELTPQNVTNLDIAWIYNSGAFNNRQQVRHHASFQTTPILIDGALIFCSQFNEVISLQPHSGEENWRFDPEVKLDLQPANRYTCRGVSHWRDKSQADTAACASRILMGTVDSRIIAVDAKTGELCKDFGDGGQVQIYPSTELRWPGELQITSAPAIAQDLVISGTSIGDNLRTSAPVGTVHAFDIRTGEPRWTFNPIPQDPQDPAFASWKNDSPHKPGHANVWSTISVDEQRGLAFIPTSSAGPDYYGGNRIGDNNYANSVVALDIETGAVKWHFQTVHHDLWDYDIPSQPGLYSVWRDGKKHDVVSLATKTGLIFVLDRDTGEPFLPIEERPVPQGAVKGEVLSPTQPFPVNTPPLVQNKLDPNDAFGVTFWDKLACKNKIASLRGEGLYTPPSEQGTLAFPFTGGGANWGSTAYDPTRNLLVVNMSNIAAYVRLTAKTGDEIQRQSIQDGAENAPMEGAPYSMERAALLSPIGLPCSPPPWGILAGVNLSSGEIVWRTTLGTTEDIAPGGIALKFGTPNFGGPIITASGLLFIGATMDDYLRAFNVQTGEELWKGRLPAGGQATPMTYQHDGRQYVVIAAGGHSPSGTRIGDSLVAFALKDTK